MSRLPDAGRVLMAVGGLILLAGALLSFGGKIPSLGRLPGDLVYRKGDFTLRLPLATSLLLSLLLTLALALFRRG